MQRRHLASCLVLIVAVAAAFVLVAPAAAKQRPVCLGKPGKRTKEPSAKAKVRTLDVMNKVIALRFDQQRDQKSRTVSVRVKPGLRPVDLAAVNVEIEEDLVTGENHTISPGEGLMVRKDRTGDGNLRVCVALNPKQVTDLHLGRYVGSVVLNGPAGEAASVPVEATFRRSRGHAWALALLGAAVGLVLKVLGELAAGKRSKKTTWKSLKDYLFHWSFLAALLVTPLIAWLGLVVLYDANATWGVGNLDSVKLFGTCAGYQLGGVAFGDLLKQIIG